MSDYFEAKAAEARAETEELLSAARLRKAKREIPQQVKKLCAAGEPIPGILVRKAKALDIPLTLRGYEYEFSADSYYAPCTDPSVLQFREQVANDLAVCESAHEEATAKLGERFADAWLVYEEAKDVSALRTDFFGAAMAYASAIVDAENRLRATRERARTSLTAEQLAVASRTQVSK